MKIHNKNLISTMALGLTMGVGFTLAQGCDGGEGGGLLTDLAEQCGLTCNENAFIEGKANISGIAGIDAFFGAAIDLEAALLGVNGELRAELDAIAVSVGLEPGAGGAEIAGEIQTRFDAALQGGIKVEYKPAQCQASVEASVSAAAECDVDVDPGSVEVSCQGECKADASVEAGCSAEAEVVCRGTAPQLACEGSCEGTCEAELSGDVGCEGTCNGTCSGACDLYDGDGNCAGRCEGMCTGQCRTELTAGATCNGKCEGTCEYTPPDGSCEANAEVSCRAMGEASIECNGTCEGEVEPPEVSAECKATVEAKASASITCTPPELAVSFQWSADFEGDLDAQAEFKAWLEGFKGHMSAIIALRARGELIADAAINLGAAGEGAVTAFVDQLSGEADLKASIGAVCALGQLPLAVESVTSASGQLTGSLQAAGMVTATIGG